MNRRQGWLVAGSVVGATLAPDPVNPAEVVAAAAASPLPVATCPFQKRLDRCRRVAHAQYEYCRGQARKAYTQCANAAMQLSPSLRHQYIQRCKVDAYGAVYSCTRNRGAARRACDQAWC